MTLSLLAHLLAKSATRDASAQINQFANNYIVPASTFKPKTIIVAHSEGTIFANLVVARAIALKPELAPCIGAVLVAPAASHVENESPDKSWTRNVLDQIINSAQISLPFDSLALNTYYGNGDSLLGHSFKDSYLTVSGTKNHIKDNINDLKAALDESCVAPEELVCGLPYESAGGVGRNQQFNYQITGSEQQDILVSFEAFAIPDNLIVKAADGEVLASTNGEVSGFHQFPIEYDLNDHGQNLTIVVDAPDQGTAWKFCASCNGEEDQCDLIDSRTTVAAGIYVTDNLNNYTCSYSGLTIDGNDYGARQYGDSHYGTEVLSAGNHVFRWETGGCYCNDIQCHTPVGVEVRIDNKTYPLNNAKSIGFEVN